MALSRSAGVVEQVSPHPTDEQVEKEKSEIRFNEKVEYQEVAIKIGDASRRNTPSDYIHSLQGAFTRQKIRHYGTVMFRFGKLMGPGVVISVVYIDPDNYAPAVSAGAEFGYKLPFMILLSNLVVIYLQVCKVRTNQRPFIHPQV
jgi:hypothetical protein